MTPPAQLYDAQGRALEPGHELGRGGEATVYALRNNPGAALKLYHRADETRFEKLALMLARPPRDPTAETGHTSLAWPWSLVVDRTARPLGFTMPYIDLQQALPLHQLYHPKTRRQRAPGISWRYLVRIARNLSSVVAALHAAGYVVGDLNESNILVTKRALVSLVDCDSVQVCSGPKLYRCLVGKGEYTAPELQGKDFQEVTRSPRHDSFALSVLIFLLLMEGVHPFSGVYRGQGEPPHLLEVIRRKQSAFLGAGDLEPAPGAPYFGTLPKELRQLFRRAFQSQHRRPSAKRWQHALEHLEESLEVCAHNAQHNYSAHLKECPWCERAATLGLEAFPAVGAGIYPKAPRQRRPTYFRGSLWAWLKRFFVTVSLLSLISGALAYLSSLVELLFPKVVPGGPLLELGVFAVTAAGLIGLGYTQTKASLHVFLRFIRLERLARALLGSALLASLLSFGIGTLTGTGNVFAGDWLLLPSLWLLAFWLLWRRRQKT